MGERVYRDLYEHMYSSSLSQFAGYVPHGTNEQVPWNPSYPFLPFTVHTSYVILSPSKMSLTMQSHGNQSNCKPPDPSNYASHGNHPDSWSLNYTSHANQPYSWSLISQSHGNQPDSWLLISQSHGNETHYFHTVMWANSAHNGFG